MSNSMWYLTEQCWKQQPPERPSVQEVARDMEIIASGKELPSVQTAPKVAEQQMSQVSQPASISQPVVEKPNEHGKGCLSCIIA